VALYAPAQPGHEDMEAVLARAMSPPHFPIPPKGLRGHWAFNSLEEGEAELEGFSFLALEIPHKGSRTFGYRVSDGRVAVAYLSDHWPLSLGAGPSGLGEYHEAALRLVDGCDIVFHDAQYTDQELPAKAYLGHSSHGYALGLAQAARARSVLFFHHDPSRTDAELDQIVEHYRGAAAITVDAAAEGRTIKL
jgi:phosphoribosyl 1,2-cyclic phosphodiesterase